MLIDYEYFGDMVSLDTTYFTTKKNRPLELFYVVNHYKKTLVFRAILLYNRRTGHLNSFFKCSWKLIKKGKKTLTGFTDQDAAIVKALHKVMLDVVHELYMWHLMKKLYQTPEQLK